MRHRVFQFTYRHFEHTDFLTKGTMRTHYIVKTMVGRRDKFKILKAGVHSITVLMMNVLLFSKATTKMLSHYQAMLHNCATTSPLVRSHRIIGAVFGKPYSDISISSKTSTAFPMRRLVPPSMHQGVSINLSLPATRLASGITRCCCWAKPSPFGLTTFRTSYKNVFRILTGLANFAQLSAVCNIAYLWHILTFRDSIAQPERQVNIHRRL